MRVTGPSLSVESPRPVVKGSATGFTRARDYIFSFNIKNKDLLHSGLALLCFRVSIWTEDAKQNKILGNNQKSFCLHLITHGSLRNSGNKLKSF